jgi:uncharacterized membrane protein
MNLQIIPLMIILFGCVTLGRYSTYSSFYCSHVMLMFFINGGYGVVPVAEGSRGSHSIASA